MAYIKIKAKDIDTSIIYVTRKELAKRVGCHENSVRHSIITDVIDALMFGNKLFIFPEDAAKFEELYKIGLLGDRRT